MSNNDFLKHYGIKGQTWGVRRFQNEDGTLTEEGKARYYDSLTDKQKKVYDKMSPKFRKRMDKKLSEGKSWNKAVQEMNSEARKRTSQMIGLGLATAALYVNPVTRPMMKAAGRFAVKAGKSLFGAIKNSNAVQRGALWMKKNASRRSMIKKGAVVMKPGSYSVRDIPFGGYIGR